MLAMLEDDDSVFVAMCARARGTRQIGESRQIAPT
jgi:hypothetical protein